MGNAALILIDSASKPPVEWPVTVDERTMDKLHQVSELELQLLREISASNAQVRDTNAAILEQLKETTKDQETRIRGLEAVWMYAKGGAGAVIFFGLVAKGAQLFWAWGVKP